ncbi:unnamed protein product [Onchocerca ochengi]|uniref:Integrase_H2C2 domain-containing protein n=1 Tax=Onchocerca ochengi TaxID=42157 RepID=A0A182EJL3_ONCOC|nr:unnamed protein product [Onchocerca ochengi]
MEGTTIPRLELLAVLIGAGVAYTISRLRKTFWIPKGRAEVKRVLNKCMVCKRWMAKPFKLPTMPKYPESLVTLLEQSLETLMDQELQVKEFLTKGGMKWKNIILKAPWSGGIYEREEYLTSLRERTQIEHKSPRSVEVRVPSKGEMVLVKEAEAPRDGSWHKLKNLRKVLMERKENVLPIPALSYGIARRPQNAAYTEESENLMH